MTKISVTVALHRGKDEKEYMETCAHVSDDQFNPLHVVEQANKLFDAAMAGVGLKVTTIESKPK